MKAPPRLRRGIGRVTGSVMQQTLHAGAMVAGRADALREAADSVTRWRPDSAWILARITGATTISGQTNRWSYAWEQVELLTDGVQAVTGGLNDTAHGKALNLCELQNNGLGIEGPGWDIDTAPTGFALQPIRNACVQLWHGYNAAGDTAWFFTLANVLDGEC